MASDQHQRHLYPKIEDSTSSSSSCSSTSSTSLDQNGKNDLSSNGDQSFHVLPTSSSSTLRMLSKPGKKAGPTSSLGSGKLSSKNQNYFRRISSVKSFLTGDKGFRLPTWLYRAALIVAVASICTSLHFTHTLLDAKSRKVFNYSPNYDPSSERVELQYEVQGFAKSNCFVSMVVGSDVARSFGIGHLVLGHSFKLHSKLDPPAKMVLIYNTHADLSLIGKIRRAGIWDWFVEMPELSFRNQSESMRPSDMSLFRVTAWKLEICKRVVWMSSDSIVMQNIDDLFIPSTTTGESSQVLASRGLMVFEPSNIEYQRMMKMASEFNMERMTDGDNIDVLSIDQFVIRENFGKRVSTLHWWHSVEVSSVVKAYMQNDAGKLLDWILENTNSTDFSRANFLINDPWLNVQDSYKRVALHLSQRHNWRTAVYRCSWLQPWKPYGGSFYYQEESKGSPSRVSKFSEFVFGIWDDACVDLITNYPTVKEDFGPFNQPWCQPKEERNAVQELILCQR
mmetsp:Transcript_29534/g.41179  ORF Transcript_29534/g.41179 Transcript_29534/m.41179 type:complete len:508 (+) Transcript_29534:76-1599(+)|eukprot:CAMPEP_0185278866 /NCGR_PEP_ID=MMETSP1359-20130426/62081_1 /TAXON_ID=552665 /ORGANISM="Bigelowiella longifila, Strain CCMP242" /LENGTH=507 /DNA_ID=CAMNT_0027873533 /DNA_START=71 /DNA_END=1594 /DNA_ORIENTATION=-